MIVFPNGKINIGLQVLRRRPDGFHDLATVFYPIALQDGLEVIASSTGSSSLTTSGLAIDAAPAENICLKAWEILKKDFPDLPAVQVHLHKVIPSGAGLGGGSADGAFMLRVLDQKFRLGLNDDQLSEYALQLGSDCPFFIKNQPCFATGRGEVLQPIDLDLSGYKLVLVNPRIHVPTAWAFSQLNPSPSHIKLDEAIRLPVDQWKDVITNDFETVVGRAHPEILEIVKELYAQGAVYASMSGSGSTVYGLFTREAAPVLDLPPAYFVRHI